MGCEWEMKSWLKESERQKRRLMTVTSLRWVWVPHPSAFCALGWDSTTASAKGSFSNSLTPTI